MSSETTSAPHRVDERPRNVVFAAPADDPRARRPADVSKFVIYMAIVLLSGWAYATPSDLDQRVAEFFSGDLPGWISGTFTIVFIVGGLYAVGLLLAILFFGQGRAAIARDMVAAVFLAIGSAIGMAALTGPEFADFFPEILERDGVPSFPVTRLTFAVAMVSVARPYLALPMRRVGSRLLAAMAVSAVVMTYGSVSATIGAVALGAAAAAGVHLLFGSGVGIPSKARIKDDLSSIGLDMSDFDYLEDQPIGATFLRGRTVEGVDSLIKVYGRDAADAAAASRVWRSIWYRDHDRALTASGLQQVEHEGLMLLQAHSAGASVPKLLGLGRGPTGDALLVTAWPDGTPLAGLADDIDDATLARCWDAVNRLHDARLVHGSLDSSRIVATQDQVVLRDLSGAALASDRDARSRDLAQMLVVTTLAAGADRAVAAAREGVGDELLTESLPLIQGNALSTALQGEVKTAGLKLKDLRASTAEALGAESPEPVQLERVTWGNVAMLGLTLFAAYALISSLSDIGFDTIIEEIGDAEWAWIVIALILAQMTNIGEYFSLTGVVKSNVPFGPTIMFRYALSFIELAVPGDAGAIAMNIRYMRKLGESTAAAVAQGPLLTVFSKGFDIILLLIAGRIIGQTVDLDDLDTGALFSLLLLVLFAIVAGVVVVLVVPKLRARLLPHLKEGLGAMRGSVTNPERLLRVAGGTLFQKMLFAMTLGASVAAYGESIGFAEAVFVNSAVSLFVGLIPVPGGVGVGEAAVTAGLVAVGIPEEQAVAAAITHRMVTAYLPPVFGWYASRWLGERDYL